MVMPRYSSTNWRNPRNGWQWAKLQAEWQREPEIILLAVFTPITLHGALRVLGGERGFLSALAGENTVDFSGVVHAL